MSADFANISRVQPVLVYGRTQKAYNRELRRVYRDTKREKGQVPRPEDTWVRVQVEELRIVDADLASRVEERLHDLRQRYLSSLRKKNGRAPEKAHGKYLLSGGMLVCPSCGGHFEARKYPWKPSAKTSEKLPPKSRVGHPGHVYICSTRRRNPGVCNNTLALPIEKTDDTILSIIEGEVLGTDYIRELLSLIESAPDETPRLLADKERLEAERDNLVNSIAAGVPADTVAPAIREREDQLRRLEARLRIPSVTKRTRNVCVQRWSSGRRSGNGNSVESPGWRDCCCAGSSALSCCTTRANDLIL